MNLEQLIKRAEYISEKKVIAFEEVNISVNAGIESLDPTKMYGGILTKGNSDADKIIAELGDKGFRTIVTLSGAVSMPIIFNKIASAIEYQEVDYSAYTFIGYEFTLA